VRSKADISQLNLPHGTNNWKVENRKKLKRNKQICSAVSVNSSRGIREVSAEEEKEGLRWEELAEKKVLSLEQKSEGRGGILLVISMHVSSITVVADCSDRLNR